MHKIQRRHINYVTKQPYYRTYSARSVLGYVGTAVVDPDQNDFMSWDCVFDTPYPVDSVLFITADLYRPTGIKQALEIVSFTNEGFSSKKSFWADVNVYNPAETDTLVAYAPEFPLAESAITPGTEFPTLAIVVEIDPESYFDLT